MISPRHLPTEPDLSSDPQDRPARHDQSPRHEPSPAPVERDVSPGTFLRRGLRVQVALVAGFTLAVATGHLLIAGLAVLGVILNSILLLVHLRGA